MACYGYRNDIEMKWNAPASVGLGIRNGGNTPGILRHFCAAEAAANYKCEAAGAAFTARFEVGVTIHIISQLGNYI